MPPAACHAPRAHPFFAYHAHAHAYAHVARTSSPYWELEQRLNGTADDMVALPNGWIAVKNRDTLIESEEANGLAAATSRQFVFVLVM